MPVHCVRYVAVMYFWRRHTALSLLMTVVLALAGSARGDALDDRVQAQMRWQRIPGLSIAVIKNGKVVRMRGYGFSNLETRTPARAQTVYKIGSVSKSFIAEWAYSNPGYYVLAEIIRNTSGQAWTSFIASRLFAPAGMGATRAATRAIVPDRASGYETRNGELQNAEQWLAVRPSGAFLSTVADFARWDAVLYDESLLTAATRKQMWSAATLSDGQAAPYGLGWFTDTVKGQLHVHHDGGVPGFVSAFHRFPDARLSVVVMANIGNRDPTDLVLGVAEHYVPALAPAPVPPIHDSEPELTSRLKSFVDQLQERVIDETLLTLETTNYLREDLARGFADRLREQGKLTRMELLERKVVGENRVYRYRLVYPHLTLFANFKISTKNKIDAWSLTD